MTFSEIYSGIEMRFSNDSTRDSSSPSRLTSRSELFSKDNIWHLPSSKIYLLSKKNIYFRKAATFGRSSYFRERFYFQAAATFVEEGALFPVP